SAEHRPALDLAGQGLVGADNDSSVRTNSARIFWFLFAAGALLVYKKNLRPRLTSFLNPRAQPCGAASPDSTRRSDRAERVNPVFVFLLQGCSPDPALPLARPFLGRSSPCDAEVSRSSSC